LKLTSQIVDKQIDKDNFALISTNEKRQIVLPKEKGVYMVVLSTANEIEVQTYTGLLKLY
jgi:hypothetical protein